MQNEKIELNHIRITPDQNYIAFFLTMVCNLRCPYCINLHNGKTGMNSANRSHLTADDWILAVNRLVLREDLPLTLQGGEPTFYKGFYRIVNETKEEIKMDLLTNMTFDVDEFIRRVPVGRFTRKAPYASIRVTYHPGQNDINDLIYKTFKLQEAGFRIGLYGILHPDEEKKRHILEVRETCLKKGIDFRTKEFLGNYGDKLCGTFKYDGAVCGDETKFCECRTSEIIVGPSGYIYRCHSDLYSGKAPIAHILDENLKAEEIYKFRECCNYGECNPCDVKVKTNRFQIFGHTSVEIKNIKKLKRENEKLSIRRA